MALIILNTGYLPKEVSDLKADFPVVYDNLLDECVRRMCREQIVAVSKGWKEPSYGHYN